MSECPKVEYSEVLQALKEMDVRDRYGGNGEPPACDDLRHAMQNLYQVSPGDRVSVLGIDVYRYSQYKDLEQALIPLVLRLIYEEAAHDCLFQECYLFQQFLKRPEERVGTRIAGSRFRKRWIDTGDGGYQLLDTPLHALLFALKFETDVRSYNSGHFYPKLRQVVGALSLRYCITSEAAFRFEHNLYGAAIINNARILSRDTLNRCLMDEATFDWFTLRFNGIEGLEFASLNEIKGLPEFADYDPDYLSKSNVLIPAEVGEAELPMHFVAAQKIGTIEAKEQKMSIYNLYVQLLIVLSENRSKKGSLFVVSLGNLNTSGL
jgi:hypothetical protein